jgi:hypothetical protein
MTFLIVNLQICVLMLATLQLSRCWMEKRQCASATTFFMIATLKVTVVDFYLVSSENRQGFLWMQDYMLLLLLVTCSCAGFLFGDSMAGGTKLGATGLVRPHLSDLEAVRFGAVIFLVIGWVGQITFWALSGGPVVYYSAPHGHAGAWATTSGYIYNLRLFFYPALYLLRHQSLLGSTTLVDRSIFRITLSLLLFEAWMFGDRGTVIRLVLVYYTPLLVVGPAFARANRLVPSAACILATVFVLVAPHFRESLHLSPGVGLVQRARQLLTESPRDLVQAVTTGEELLVAAATVGTAQSEGAVDLGMHWLYPFVSTIPRTLWPSKPYPADWSPIRPRDAVKSGRGWTVTSGAAWGGFADSFLRFSWAGALVWILFGWLSGRAWRRAILTLSPLGGGWLFISQVATIHAVLQGFNSAIYVFIIFGFVVFLTPYVGRTLQHGR